ncbi:hypothetical protein GCM10023084_81970 [Streptomyces lacrimifluminis]
MELATAAITVPVFVIWSDARAYWSRVSIARLRAPLMGAFSLGVATPALHLVERLELARPLFVLELRVVRGEDLDIDPLRRGIRLRTLDLDLHPPPVRQEQIARDPRGVLALRVHEVVLPAHQLAD